MEASLVPAGISNRYQWKTKAPVEKPGVLSRGQWSRLRGTGWETGAFGLSQPVPKARFLVVINVNVDMKFLMPPFPNLKTKNNMHSLEPLSPFSLQALVRNESSAPVSQSPANP